MYRHTQCGPVRKCKSKLMLFEIVIFENGIQNCDEGQDSWANRNSAFLIRQEIQYEFMEILPTLESPSPSSLQNRTPHRRPRRLQLVHNQIQVFCTMDFQ